eukprot:403376456
MRWQSRIIRGTPHAANRNGIHMGQDRGNGNSDSQYEDRSPQLSQKLNSNSPLRIFFYNLRKSMILQPCKGIIINIVAGFLVNIQIMLTAVIIFEKISDGMLSFTKSIIPLISLASMLLAVSIFSLIILMTDLLQKGCLAWHRDSIGLLIQRMVFSICFLFTSIYLYNYVDHHENSDSHEYAQDSQTLFGCLVPMLVFMGLSILKVSCVRSLNTAVWIVVCICMTSLALIIHFEIDKGVQNLPVFLKAIPIAVMLFTFSGNQAYRVVYEQDPAKVLLRGYNQKFRIFTTLISCCLTICFVISIITSLYLIKVRQQDHEDTKDILQFILIASVAYLGLQIEIAGQIVLDIVFEQFDFELIEFVNNNDKNKRFYQQGKRQVANNGQKHQEGSSEMADRSNKNGLALNINALNNQRTIANLKNTPQLGGSRTAELQKPLLGQQMQKLSGQQSPPNMIDHSL